ncbi:hypothetical protein JG559_06740 [Enterococcus faecalis]|uniref:Uncharacterized protein n=1 Tax=Enterococcus faecalis TaxID=1351 RepID=A0A974S6J0_ENTFL|nr:hypothetical protein JG559_06740 [Enterococcus faecalis]
MLAYLREIVYNPDLISNTAVYYVIDKPVYYYLTNRKVTENFVDTSGAKNYTTNRFHPKENKQRLPVTHTPSNKRYLT